MWMRWLPRVSVLRLLNHFPHRDQLPCVGSICTLASSVGRIFLVVSYIIVASSSCFALIFHTDSLRSALPTSQINNRSHVHNHICLLFASRIRNEKLSGLCQGVKIAFICDDPKGIIFPSCSGVWIFCANKFANVYCCSCFLVYLQMTTSKVCMRMCFIYSYDLCVMLFCIIIVFARISFRIYHYSLSIANCDV